MPSPERTAHVQDRRLSHAIKQAVGQARVAQLRADLAVRMALQDHPRAREIREEAILLWADARVYAGISEEAGRLIEQARIALFPAKNEAETAPTEGEDDGTPN